MSQPEPLIEPVADVRTARVALAVLVVAWAALAYWVLSHGERLIGGTLGEAHVATGRPSPDDPPRVGAGTDSARVGEPAGVAGSGENTDAAVQTAVAREVELAVPADALATPTNDGDRSVDTGSSDAAEPVVPDSRSEPIDALERSERSEPPEPSERSGPSEAIDPSSASAPGAGASSSVGAGANGGIDGVDDDAGESVFETRRREEIATLSTLLGERLAFERLGSAPLATSREPLERAFEILFLYPGTRLRLTVESRETNDAAFDRQLARERGGAVVDYLVSRGIERERLRADAGDGSGLPFGEHRVRVTVEDENR